MDVGDITYRLDMGSRPARTDVLTVDRQMADYIDLRGRRDHHFRARLQRFLQGEGATFDLPVDPVAAAPIATRRRLPALRGWRARP